jgi:hypothetical protein
MRIFRQPTAGDWDTPVAAVMKELAAYKKMPSNLRV